MKPEQLLFGQYTQVVRALEGHGPDPVDVYAQLTQQGSKKDTLFLESAAHMQFRGETSLVVARSAVRVRCEDRTVYVEALNSNGENFLLWFKEYFSPENLGYADNRKLKLIFPATQKGSEAERMKAASPIDVLRLMTKKPELVAGQENFGLLVTGVFSYDFVGVYEELPPLQSEGMEWPDFEFWLPDELVWMNHTHRQATVVSFVFAGPSAREVHQDAVNAVAHIAQVYRALPDQSQKKALEVDFGLTLVSKGQALEECTIQGNEFSSAVESDLDDAAYRTVVEALREHIVKGDIIQVVPSRTFRLPCHNPLNAYRALRALNPSPYMFWVQSSFGTLFGASPETAVRVNARSRKVEIRPIAGTRRRGLRPDGSIDLDADNRLEAELRLDSKENAEHMMLVDLARNDIARVSRPGSRGVSKLLAVDKYSHVMHLVSVVEGTLREDLDALDAYVATMNMGTLVGAPKIKAAQLLRHYEKTRRGPYGGSVGYFNAQGDFDSCIVIRSAFVKEGIAHVRAGAGVVFDSQAQAEANETRQKATAVLRAIVISESERIREGSHQAVTP